MRHGARESYGYVKFRADHLSALAHLERHRHPTLVTGRPRSTNSATQNASKLPDHLEVLSTAYAPPTANDDLSVFQFHPFHFLFYPIDNPDFKRRRVDLAFYRDNLTLPGVIALCWRHYFRPECSHLRPGRL